ncbi:MAG: class I SAM-dependent methyltransferase [Phycisphaerales bacterium JB043]
MGLTKTIRKLTHRPLVGAPIQCRHMNYSVIASLDDDPSVPSERLFDIACASIEHARRYTYTTMQQRLHDQPELIRNMVNTWPGEHYRLLAGVLQALRPRTIVEIGTYTGLSSLAMLESMPEESTLVTYDVIPWDQLSGTVLLESDFEDGRLTQHIADLANADVFREHAGVLQQADLLFVDGPKDARFERAFLDNLETIELPRKPILLFDDIRVWNMLRIWRSITRPKLDLTSFGHWSGTGIVDWS